MSDHSITSLIEKLEGASEGSREIDGLIYANEHGLELNGCTFILEINGYETFQFKHPTLMHPNGPAALYEPGHKVPEVSTSLDAALAQAERVLKGGLKSYQIAGFFGRHVVSLGDGEPTSAATPALALCAAALCAQTETGALNACSKSITSQHGLTDPTCASTWETLASCVAVAMTGFIPEAMRNGCSYELRLTTHQGYTAIQARGKPAADGPRYKALGNSMAVPVMSWIGRRIAAVDALPHHQKAAA